MKLNILSRKFLKANGISVAFFAKWIGADYSQVNRWLSGQRSLKKEQQRKVLEFLSGEFLTPLDDLIGGVES